MERPQYGKRRSSQQAAGAANATTPMGSAKVRTGRWQGVVTLLGALSVAGGAAYGIVSMQDNAGQAREAQYVLASLDADTLTPDTVSAVTEFPIR